jgi:transcriptional regulator with XRE-family HTH domain
MGVDIGGKVKSIRQSKAMTQSELAKRSGVAQSTLSYIEKGDKHPRFKTLSAICKGLNVSVFELLSYGEKASRTKLFKAQLSAISQGSAGDTQSSYDLEKYIYEKLIQTDNNK